MKDKIKKSLMSLYYLAKRQNLNLKTYYQNIVFTPEEALEAWNENRFLWGPINWILVNERQELIHRGEDIK